MFKGKDIWVSVLLEGTDCDKKGYLKCILYVVLKMNAT